VIAIPWRAFVDGDGDEMLTICCCC